MKTIVITIFLLVFLIPGAEAGILLELKNGNTMIWSNYTEEADQYCTQKSSGKFCMPKSAVASIAAKEEANPDAVVIVNKSSDDGKESTNKEADGKSWEIKALEKTKAERRKKEKEADYEFNLKRDELWAECEKKCRGNPSSCRVIHKECFAKIEELRKEYYRKIDE